MQSFLPTLPLHQVFVSPMTGSNRRIVDFVGADTRSYAVGGVHGGGGRRRADEVGMNI